MTAKIEGLYYAITEGFRSSGLLPKLERLETENRTLDQALSEPPPPPMRLHADLAKLYRAKVVALREALAHPEIRDKALKLLRGLITRVVVQRDQSGSWNLHF